MLLDLNRWKKKFSRKKLWISFQNRGGREIGINMVHGSLMRADGNDTSLFYPREQVGVDIGSDFLNIS